MTAAEMLPQLDRFGFEVAKSLLGALWQSTLLLAAVAAISWFLRRRKASLRHALWAAAIVAAPFLPFLAGSLSRSGAPQAEVAVLPSYEAPYEAIEPEPTFGPVAATSPAPAAGPAVVQPTVTTKPSRPAVWEFPWALGLIGYCAGVTILLVWICAGRMQLARWIRNARLASDERVGAAFERVRRTLALSRRFRVMESANVRAPFTVGVWSPVVVLPLRFAEGLSDNEVYAVALHETAHVRRRDPLTFSLVVLVRAALFFHPLVWLAVRRVSLYAEQAADDAVLEATGEPFSYARTLARIAEGICRRALTAEVAVGIVLTRGAFLSRVEAILSDRSDRIRKLSLPALGAMLAAVALSLAIALLMPLAEKGGGKEQPRAGIPSVDSSGAGQQEGVHSAPDAAPARSTSQLYDFAVPADCEKWTNITPGSGNDFSGGVANLSAPQGRAFLLNTTPQARDLAVEVKAANESGPAYAWILLRYKDANNFYEVVLKKTHVEVWHKYQGQYLDILRRLDVDTTSSQSHVFKAQMAGQVPAIAVWLDGKLLWSGKDELDVEPSDGRLLALETEFSTVAVQSVTVSAPVTVPQGATSAEGASTSESAAGPEAEAPAVDSTAPHGVIQTLIDEAAPGAVVRVPGGTYDECVTIAKPLTLEGAGWEKTAIRQLAAEEPADASAQLERRLQSASSRAERARLSTQFRDRYRRPAILVSGTGPVTIAGIKVIGLAGGDKRRLLDDTAIEVRSSQVEISKCAVLRSRGCGILVLDGSQARIRDCLVAAVWNTGIVVASASSAGASAEIADCDVRNCYSRCITVGRGCDSTVIRGCRISGSAWHGIRYDNASPTIEDCFIFGNARFGIYAAGRTAASVRRNALSGNEMAGMWCLQGNRDMVKDNVFAGNIREALDIMEPSRPLISSNTFRDNPVAIQIGFDSRNPTPKSDEPLRIEGNIFDRNRTDITKAIWEAGTQETVVETLKVSDFPGNFESAVSVGSTDAATAPKAGGTPALSDVKSPWPLQAEESAIIPDSDTRDYQQWKLP
jgi:beta-lactamase regulating signal transducer with metallopeptidase domain